MLGLLMSAIIASGPTVGPTVTYDELINMAINECPHAYWERVNEEILENLVAIEEYHFEKHKIPDGLRGMLLAAACIESGYNPRAQGDWAKTSTGKSYARAKGIVQLWPWWSQKYKIDRFDYKDSARAWIQHVVKQRHKIEKFGWCPARFSNEKKWVVAWVQTARGPARKAGSHRCNEIPSHYKLLKKWRQQTKQHVHNNSCEC
jgi:hypothetical protein